MIETYITLRVTHRPSADLCEFIAQRAYTLPCVDDVEIMACFPAVSEPANKCSNGHAHEVCA